MKKNVTFIVIYFIIFYGLLLYPNKSINVLASNIMTITVYALSLGYLIYAIKGVRGKSYWILIAVGIGFGLIGELIWSYREIVLNISQWSIISEVMYAIMTLMLTYAVIYNIAQKHQLKNILKRILKSIPIIFTLIYIIYILCFNGEFFAVWECTFIQKINFAFLACDLIMILLMTIFFFQKNIKNRNRSLELVQAAGIFIYAFADIIFCYEVFINKYATGNLIDPLWGIGICLISLSAYFEINNVDIRYMRDIIVYNKKTRYILNVIGIIGMISVIFSHTNYKIKLIASIILLILFLVATQMEVVGHKQNLQRLNETLSNQVEQINILNKKLNNRNSLLKEMAYLDTLTSLGNRRLFEREANKIIILAKSGKIDGFAMLLMDLNRFKSINDWYGHHIGDELIIQVANRLSEVSPKEAIITRQGGDEFMILFKDVISEEKILESTEKIISAFEKPLKVFENEFMVTFSIGVAIYPNNGEDINTLIKNTDVAMYKAKCNGDNKVVFYASGEGVRDFRKIRIEHLLRAINFDEEFIIHYQPQIRINENNNITGVEALIRWQNSELGFVSPSEFISIAEESGSIIPISKWVLNKAVKQISEWNNRYHSNIKIGINISPKYFTSQSFISDLDEIIAKYQAKPYWIDIEITEEVSMKDPIKMQEIISVLKEKGYKISIDDFGTGYSSFGYLSTMNFDTLKIAMPFVSGIHEKDEAYEIVKTIINIAKIFNMQIIAEGVELAEQLDKLIELGCDEVQGYYFSKPISKEEIEKILTKQY